MRGRIFTHSLLLFLAVTLTLSLTACGPKKPRPSVGKAAGGVGADGEISTLPEAGGIGVGERGLATSGNWKHGEFEPVYFDYDSATVKPDEVGKLQKVADKVGSGTQVIVEGHADERGTAEYNRALGERRALACREELVRMGVPSGNVSTVSYGEERPSATGHDESAWSANRRCEFATVGE